MTASKIFFYLCLSCIAGIACQSLIDFPQVSIWGFLLLAVAGVSVSFFIPSTFKIPVLLIGLCLLCSAVGISRYRVVQSAVDNDSVRHLNDRPEKITLAGYVADEPDIRESFQKLKVKIDGTESIVLVSTSRHPDYHYLDEVRLIGKLKTPAVSDDFNYQEYLLKDRIYSVMDFPNIEINSKHPYTIFSWSYEKILWVKERLELSIHENFSKNDESILEGILLGENKTMDQDIKLRLNAAGLTHLTAISGGNIIIASDIIFMLLLMLGLWRGQAFYGALVGIWLYIIITGMPASGVRAAIMGSLFLLAQKVGRQYTGVRAITFAAMGMLFINPFVLRYDIGFQLSFLASLGILYAKPLCDTFFHPMVNILGKEPQTKIRVFLKNSLKIGCDILSVTLAAQLFTLPIIVYNFGMVSLTAPLSNILVLPMIPWLMGFGFLCAVLGIISKFLAWVLFIPTKILLWYFFTIVSSFSKPWMTLVFTDISWLWLVIYYAFLWIFMFFWHRKKKAEIFEY